jgi:hypothetical protein
VQPFIEARKLVAASAANQQQTSAFWFTGPCRLKPLARIGRLPRQFDNARPAVCAVICRKMSATPPFYGPPRHTFQRDHRRDATRSWQFCRRRLRSRRTFASVMAPRVSRRPDQGMLLRTVVVTKDRAEAPPARRAPAVVADHCLFSGFSNLAPTLSDRAHSRQHGPNASDQRPPTVDNSQAIGYIRRHSHVHLR